MGPEVVRHVVHKGSRPRLRSCYEKALLRNPTLAGPMRVHFTIGPTGDVLAVSVDKPGLEAELDACVAAEFMRLRFPAPSGGGKVNVMYPIEFRPE